MKVDKLELKHLAPYLPYSLMVNYDWMGIDNVTFKMTHPVNMIESELTYQNLKPILRPLSDLTKELYFELSGKSEKNHFGMWYGKNNGDRDKRDYIYHSGYSGRYYFLCDGYGQFTCGMMDFFLQNHFDVFGLIPDGLAIDINTLSNDN